jgi:23S rRNA pseudouridine1911/1915/1917 synthase
MRLIVDEGSAGARLDAFLVARGGAGSVAAARRAIAAGQVHLEGGRARKGTRLAPGQVVTTTADAPAPAGVVPRPELPLQVLYEDRYLVAVDKPAGIPSHPLRAGETASVAAALVARYPDCAQASADPREGGLGHRLDVGTSGVLVAARDRETWAALRQALGSEGCEKTYLAEVRGVLPDTADRPFVEVGTRPGALAVTAPIGRIGRRGSRVRLAGGRNPLPARTEVAVRERRGATTLVTAWLSRGRAHQVRAHLAHLGCPVVGDALYGPEDSTGPLHLHALALALRHPATGAPLCIEAPLPDWAANPTKKREFLPLPGMG